MNSFDFLIYMYILFYTRKSESGINMDNVMTTKVFSSGNSQAVRLPKQFRLEEGEVCITKENDRIVIFTKPSKFTSLKEVQEFFNSVHCPDFELERDMSLPTNIDLIGMYRYEN